MVYDRSCSGDPHSRWGDDLQLLKRISFGPEAVHDYSDALGAGSRSRAMTLLLMKLNEHPTTHVHHEPRTCDLAYTHNVLTLIDTPHSLRIHRCPRRGPRPIRQVRLIPIHQLPQEPQIRILIRNRRRHRAHSNSNCLIRNHRVPERTYLVLNSNRLIGPLLQLQVRPNNREYESDSG